MKSKGFTLIELLAVIVILAIIALIATPIILNIIEDAKENTLEQSSHMYKKAVEIALAKSSLNGIEIETGTYVIDSEGNLLYGDKKIKVEIDNYDFDDGVVIIKDQKVEKLSLNRDNKIITNGEEEKFDIWDGSISEVITDNDGNYHITKTSELAWIASQVNSGNTFEGKTIYLENNLDLNKLEWMPIGKKDSVFSGIFEGNNYVIKNLYIPKSTQNTEENKRLGLFGYIINSTINDLVIYNCDIKGRSNIGCLVGTAQNSTINSINIFNNKLSGIQNIGGLTGVSKSVKINHINIYSANIEGESQIGGAIPNFTENSELNNISIYDSKIKGTTNYIGGVVGATTNAIITNVYSNASVDSSQSTQRLSGTGGIVGIVLENGILENLISEATVKGSSDVGGIIGQFQGNSVLTNSISYAKVEGTNYIGGVIGIDSAYEAVNNLENIESYANVTGTGECIGGVVAHISQGEHNYKNIYSKANVIGNDKVGGIIGGFYSDDKTILNYKNIISEAIVTGTTNYNDLYGYINSNSIIKLIEG